MRPLQTFSMLLVIAAITAACAGASPGASTDGQSQGSEPSQGAGQSQGSEPSQGGGGGGGGPNGSITYRITGEYEASGELPFLAQGISLWIESEGGWVANFANLSGEGAYILINTQTRAQILTYGDGAVSVAAASDAGYDCTFDMPKNDSSGLRGSLECNDIPASDVNTGAQMTVDLVAEWDAHP